MQLTNLIRHSARARMIPLQWQIKVTARCSNSLIVKYMCIKMSMLQSTMLEVLEARRANEFVHHPK